MATVETLPPSLAVVPNIPWHEQTIEQLEAEMAHWELCVETASGFASAWVADGFRKSCLRWLERRRAERDSTQRTDDTTSSAG